MRFGLFSYAVVTSLLALPGWAQQSGGYEIRGQDPRLTEQTIYLLPAERPPHGQPWRGLDSTRADAMRWGISYYRATFPPPMCTGYE